MYYVHTFSLTWRPSYPSLADSFLLVDWHTYLGEMVALIVP